MADLQALQRENAKLQKSFKELELTVQQIESQKLSFGSNGVGPPQWNSNSQSHITNVKYLKDSFLKIKRAAVIDGKTIRAQEIAIDQEKQLRQTIRKELVAIKGRIKKYIEHNNQNKGNNNNSNANENKEAIEQLAYFRKTCRERLLLVRSEINAMAANQEAAFVSKKEAKNVRVTYWNGRGLAEPTRLMLSAGNIKFTDRFMSKASDLEAVRKEHNLFYQQLPLVEIDNMELVQSGAQMRYIARRCGMYGDSDSERYIIDVIYEGTRDARGPLTRYWSRGVGMKETKEAVCLFLFLYIFVFKIDCARIMRPYFVLCDGCD